jgi:thiol-disulfide isomerase/thioredoxin
MSLRRLTGALLTGALLLTGCTSVGETNSNGYIEGDSNVVQFGVDERSDPVEMTGETLDGEPFDLADYRGQVVVMNAWGSWCGPCNREMPLLVEAAEELGDTAAFVGINLRDPSRENALAFERQYGVTYPSVDGSTDPSVLLGFGSQRPRNVPFTAIIDARGQVAALIPGEVPGKVTLIDLVEEIAAEGASPWGSGSRRPPARGRWCWPCRSR